MDKSLHTIRTTLEKEPALIEFQVSMDGLLLVLHWFNNDDLPKTTDLFFTSVSDLQIELTRFDQFEVVSLGAYEPEPARLQLCLGGRPFATFSFVAVRATVSNRR